MTILSQIQQWSQGLSDWQQDAVRRLYFAGSLTPSDYADLYAILKSSHGIPDPEERVGTALTKDDIAAEQSEGTAVKLLAVKELAHVNALAGGQKLSILPEGMTVIYGDNGSGKSGYSRLLKSACRARDKKEVILPNAAHPEEEWGTPTAIFEVKINDREEERTWTAGVPADEHLSTISIFDARCARAYIDDEDDFSYVPAGLDILKNLAKACDQLKVRLDSELRVPVDVSAFQSLLTPQSQAGKMILELSANTRFDEVEALATVSHEENERYWVLSASLKAENPKEKAQQIRLRAGRVAKLATRCEDALSKVNDSIAENLRRLSDSFWAAKNAADAAATGFKETPGQLEGTGGEDWKILFEAARKFATVSHPRHDFPRLAPESQCPLCQQPLGEAAQRLLDFDAFIQNTTEKTAEERRTAIRQALESLNDATLSIGLDVELQFELDAIKEGFSETCLNFEAAVAVRRTALEQACRNKLPWENVESLNVEVLTELRLQSEKLSEEAASLDLVADEATRTKLVTEFNELHARQLLIPLKEGIRKAISEFVHRGILERCKMAVKTNAITSKTTELTQLFVTDLLVSTLNSELEQLGTNGLSVSLESVSGKGKALHKLVLQLPGRRALTHILSEGEQRAIAIGAFLAEVRVSGGGGVIFDDPVSSLDHRRRERVAERLVKEAKSRQVIIFTHDVYFLCILQQEAELQSVNCLSQSLQRTSAGFGVANSSLPFEASPTKKRVGALRVMQERCAQLHRQNEEEKFRKLTQDTYFYLRLAWERAVEEVLLGGVVIRFREGVSTQQLKGVTVEDADYATVEAGMTKASKHAHDRASVAMLTVPLPDELKADIEALEAWRGQLTTRGEAVRKRR